MPKDKGRRRGTQTLDPKDVERIASEVAKQLPGWHLAKQPDNSSMDSVRSHATSRGATLEDLRRKFLPADEAADNAAAAGADAAAAPEAQPDRVTILVEQDSGGAAKVADVVGGQVKLVQG